MNTYLEYLMVLYVKEKNSFMKTNLTLTLVHIIQASYYEE